MTMTAALLLLGTLGTLLSLYAALAYYGVALPGCQAERSSCRTVLTRPEARLLGVPNAVLGLLLYIGVFIAASFGAALPPLLGRALLLASGLSVVAGIYLSALLLFRFRTKCAVCFASHAVNACLFVLLVAHWG